MACNQCDWVVIMLLESKHFMPAEVLLRAEVHLCWATVAAAI